MIEHNKTYGFTIAVKELKETVPNIFRYASAYKRVNNIKSKGLWEMFVEPDPEEPKKRPEDAPGYKPPIPEQILRSSSKLPEVDPEAMEGEKYNMCHFWSNFEIARLSWFRSKEYEDFFQMMDRSGGFWMERVCLPSPLNITEYLLTHHSGATHLSTHWPLALSSHRVMSTISATSGTATQRSSIALRTLQRDS
jgi:hypothetical protein